MSRITFKDVTNVVEQALDSGFWHIDTAASESSVSLPTNASDYLCPG